MFSSGAATVGAAGQMAKSNILLRKQLREHVQNSLAEHGIDASAEKVTRDITTKLCHAWGGCQIYFPKPVFFETFDRHLQIYAEFDGKNHKALAEKHKYTLQMIYRIIAKIGNYQKGKAKDF